MKVFHLHVNSNLFLSFLLNSKCKKMSNKKKETILKLSFEIKWFFFLNCNRKEEKLLIDRLLLLLL